MNVARKLFSGLNLQQSSGQPLYAALKRHIEDAVEQGVIKAGDFIPSERDAADMLQVSRVTVRKAFTHLVSEGVLAQKRGSGTFVRIPERRFEQSMSRLSSFTQDMQLRGITTTADWLDRSITLPSPEEAIKLSMSPSENVARLNRLRRANNMPLAIEIATLPARYLPDPQSLEGSLYAALENAGARPVRALQRLHAIGLAQDKAMLLKVPTGTPALFIERIAYLESGAAVEYTRSYFRGDSYDFVAELVAVPEATP